MSSMPYEPKYEPLDTSNVDEHEATSSREPPGSQGLEPELCGKNLLLRYKK